MKAIIVCFAIGLLTISCVTYAQLGNNAKRRDVNAPAALPANELNSPVRPANANLRCFNSNANVECTSLPSNSWKPSNVAANTIKPSHEKLASKKLLYDVCGNPKLQCDAPELYEDTLELPIRVRGELEWFGRYKSKPFYAVIVQSRKVIPEGMPADPDAQACGGHFSAEEHDPLRLIFPNNRVFSTAFSCYYGQHEYTNINYNFNFLAVYGGIKRSEATAVLKKIQSVGKYPRANIRRMQAILCYGCH